MNNKLEIESLIVGPIQTNCFLICNKSEALLFDPGDDADTIIGLIENKNVKVTKIILTHGHIDHIGAVTEIRNQTNAPVLIHKEDAEMLTSAQANLSVFHGEEFLAEPADGFIADGDKIEIGDVSLEVRHTPGHTRGSCSFVGDGFVISGDTLFWGSIGRSDLPGGNHEQLIESIHKKLLVLDDSFIVYSGHGPETSIGQEKEINPFLI